MGADELESALRLATTGAISEADLATLKPIYLADIGAPKNCKLCPSGPSDMKHHFSMKLKRLNLLPVKSIRKYIILGAGFLMLPGSPVTIVNEGEESEDRKVLTDALAEEILADEPGYSTLIGINPAWTAAHPEEEQSEATNDQSGSEEEPSELQAKYDTLISEHADLVEEHRKAKLENSTVRGQLTKATNELAKLREKPAVVTPAASQATVPASLISAGASRLPIDVTGVNETTGTIPATEGEGGAPDANGAPSGGSEPGTSGDNSPKGNAAADATAQVG